MKRSNYIWLAVILFISFSVTYSSRLLKKSTRPTETSANIGFDCSGIELENVSAKPVFGKNEIMDISVNGVPLGFDAEVIYKILNDRENAVLNKLDTVFSTKDNSFKGRINFAQTLKDHFPDRSDVLLLVYSNIYDDSGEMVCKGGTTVHFSDPAYCPGCTNLITVGDEGLTLGMSDLGEVLQTATEEPRPATDEAFFRWQYVGYPETFTIKLTRSDWVELARAALDGTTDRTHVAGFILKWPPSPRNYNPPWNFHMYEGNITFFRNFTDGENFCDATIRYVADHLVELDDPSSPYFLNADLLWCPLQSKIIEEVDNPYVPPCTPIGPDNRSTPQDYARWSYYFKITGTTVDGGREMGDFNCNGINDQQDYSIWSYYFYPF